MTKRRALMTPEERERACAHRRAAYRRKREQELAYAAAYREANKEWLPAYWRESNKKRKPYFDAYKAQNRERIASRRAEWKEENRERVAAKNAEWTRNNPEKNRLKSAARRALKKSSGGALSNGIVAQLMQAQSGLCACCGASLSSGYHIDHIVPLSKGGRNSDDNVQLLTPACNLQKSDRDWAEFLASRKAAVTGEVS